MFFFKPRYLSKHKLKFKKLLKNTHLFNKRGVHFLHWMLKYKNYGLLYVSDTFYNKNKIILKKFIQQN